MTTTTTTRTTTMAGSNNNNGDDDIITNEQQQQLQQQHVPTTTTTTTTTTISNNINNNVIIIKPYTMCSVVECEDRTKYNEISVFECTNDSVAASKINQRIIDPRRAVTKYRRSAAGGAGTGGRSSQEQQRQRPIRSVQQLHVTVVYLLNVLAYQHPPPLPPYNDDDETDGGQNQKHHHKQQKQQSFYDTVTFVEDRLRAVQVDLVRLQQHHGNTCNDDDDDDGSTCNDDGARRTQKQKKQLLQVYMSRCHILILYLTLDHHNLSSSKYYERKFGTKALATALATYWNNESSNGSEEYDENSGAFDSDNYNNHEYYYDDEILSYSSLVQLNSYLLKMQQSESESSSSSSEHVPSLASTALGLYRRHVNVNLDLERSNNDHQQPSALSTKLPFFQWTLDLIVDVCLGHWHIVLKKLHGDDDDDKTISTTTTNFRFNIILARCCMAQSLKYIRWKALQSYNFSFGKGEAVGVGDVQRLLYFQSNNDAFYFGHTIAGLPTTATTIPNEQDEWNSDNDNNEDLRQLLFKVSPLKELQRSHNTRDDAFVFGGGCTATTTTTTNNDSSSSSSNSTRPRRRDQDGVVVPSSEWILNLLFFNHQ